MTFDQDCWYILQLTTYIVEFLYEMIHLSVGTCSGMPSQRMAKWCSEMPHGKLLEWVPEVHLLPLYQ